MEGVGNYVCWTGGWLGQGMVQQLNKYMNL